ncbi:MAG: hypothetical protein AAF572_15630 [Cyanobacteria bacterium P01_B01_bin.77]
MLTSMAQNAIAFLDHAQLQFMNPLPTTQRPKLEIYGRIKHRSTWRR